MRAGKVVQSSPAALSMLVDAVLSSFEVSRLAFQTQRLYRRKVDERVI
jgi:hypothetical protein